MRSSISWRFEKSPITLEPIHELEREIGFMLPISYKMLLLDHHAGRPKPNLFRTEQTTVRVLKSFLPITKDHKVNVFTIQEWLKLPHGLIPFANDPAGNYLCFDYRGSLLEPKIVFFLHENRQIEQVSNTFSSFIDSLHER